MAQANLFGPTWQGELNDLANIVQHIERSHASGRLSLRNLEPLSIVHLYFRLGTLIHLVGHRGDARNILLDLQNWQRAHLRFEQSTAVVEATLTPEYKQLLHDVLTALSARGIVVLPRSQSSLVIDGEVIVTSDVKQLISPWEWRVLIEGMRRVSLAVAHLVGPREAFTVLEDILADCSETFPAFASLKIASTGYLQVVDRAHLDLMARDDLFEGFTALFAICQHFCAPIIGERDAHQLIVQSLQEMCSPLVSLGVFRVDEQLLSSH